MSYCDIGISDAAGNHVGVVTPLERRVDGQTLYGWLVGLPGTIRQETGRTVGREEALGAALRAAKDLGVEGPRQR